MSPLDSVLFAIRKLLTLAVMPLSIVFVLLALSVWLKRRGLVAACLVILYVTSIPFTAETLLRALERGYPRLEVEACPHADAIVVLGGVVRDSRGDPRSIEWSESADRFEKGVFLLQAGRANALLFTGGPLDWVRDGYTEGDAMRSAAGNFGLDPSSIYVVRGAATTADEARRVSSFAREKGWKRLILVTSAFHMRRAAMLFRREGLSVIPFPVDYRTLGSGELGLLSFVPRGGAIQDFELGLKELYALAFYSLVR
jgi:uncharacterized SAM-binding protein YcdF (DUF218 family)